MRYFALTPQVRSASRRILPIIWYTCLMSESYNENMKYSEIVIDEHLKLRQLQADEAAILFELVDTNREYLEKWLPWVVSTNTADDSRAFISTIAEKRMEGAEYGFGVIVDGQIAGHTSLMHITDGEDPEIGYWIASGMSGKGIITKSTAALTNLGLVTLGLEKIVIKADSNNTASNKVAEKLGYHLAGQEQSAEHGLINVWKISQP